MSTVASSLPDFSLRYFEYVFALIYLSFQLLELIKNPDMIEEMMNNEDKALENLQSEQENPEVITDNSDPEAKLQV